MIELKCKGCDTGIFRVQEIAQVGRLPLRLTCHTCGMQYIVKPDENGSPGVFSRKGGGRWTKMQIEGLEETVAAPMDEEVAGEPGAEETAEHETGEETAGDQVSEETGEQEDTGEDIVPSGGEAERSAEEEDTGVPSVSEGEGLAEGGEEESCG